MLTIGIKQLIIILLVGFLLFGNLPKHYNNLKEFLNSSKFDNEVKFFKNLTKKVKNKDENKKEN